MNSTGSVERRIQLLEDSVKHLRMRLGMPNTVEEWATQIGELSRDIPDEQFEEMVRAGREYRESLRPAEDSRE